GEGVLLGTPDYMAPEQARDPRATDIRGDIYALGCVLYHLLAGQPPFPDTNIISQMIRHASETPRPLADFNRAVPDGLQQILNWMLAKTPEARYPTPARAAAALEVFLAAGPPPPSSPDLDPDMAPYLHELAIEEANAPPSGQAIPVALMPTLPQIVLPADPPPKPGKRPDERRKKKGPPPPSGDMPAARPKPRIDVELVAGPKKPAEPDGEPFGPLTRRDFVMFFAGVGLVILAYLLGQGLAYVLFRRGRDADPPADG
ncbi:MAG: serine/threonine protein kinase, partial [Gemmataceae bacterium]